MSSVYALSFALLFFFTLIYYLFCSFSPSLLDKITRCLHFTQNGKPYFLSKNLSDICCSFARERKRERVRERDYCIGYSRITEKQRA